MARLPPPRSLPGATVVQPDCPHRPPATLRLAGHPQTHLRAGSPPPPLLHSMLPWLCHSLCLLYGTGVSLPKPPTGAVCFTLLPSHTGHQGSWTCALCPRSFWAPSPPAHHPATPCTSHTVPLSTVTAGFLVTNRILTRGAGGASGGLSAHLSMCLLGLVVKCVLLSRGCCLGSSSSCSTVTFHTHPRGSMVGLGRPTHIHSHSGSKSSTWPKKVHIEVPNPTCGPTPLSCLCLPSMSIVRLFLVPCDGGPHTHSSSLL